MLGASSIDSDRQRLIESLDLEAKREIDELIAVKMKEQLSRSISKELNRSRESEEEIKSQISKIKSTPRKENYIDLRL